MQYKLAYLKAGLSFFLSPLDKEWKRDNASNLENASHGLFLGIYQVTLKHQQVTPMGEIHQAINFSFKTAISVMIQT